MGWFEPSNGERPTLYEMGLPVVELEGGEPYHIDVAQRVPLNSDRDNVPASFLTEVRAHLLNTVADKLTETEAAETWTHDAAGSKLVTEHAFKTVLSKRFGDKRVAFCPADSESNRTAVGEGLNVVTGGSLSSKEWQNARRYEALPSAGETFPTARPKFGGNDDTRVPESLWSDALKRWVRICRRLGERVIEQAVFVEVVRDPANRFAAWYAKGGFLTLNLACLDEQRIEDDRQMLSLLLHELGHERCGDHKLDDYSNALCEFGGRLALLLAKEPDLLS